MGVPDYNAVSEPETLAEALSRIEPLARDGTAVLSNDGTAVLSNDGTAVLSNDGTAVLSDYGTAVLSDSGSPPSVEDALRRLGERDSASG